VVHFAFAYSGERHRPIYMSKEQFREECAALPSESRRKQREVIERGPFDVRGRRPSREDVN
jgi:hypothetical protein